MTQGGFGRKRGMRPTLVTAAIVAGTVVVLLGSGGQGSERAPKPRPDGAEATLVRAAQRTLDAGPAAVVARVRSGGLRYRLVGRVDPRRGYRLCAAVVRAPGEFPSGRSLWLQERSGTYGTLTAPGPGCAPKATWLNDHPPTLQLHPGSHLPPRGSRGAEDFLHATLLALTGLDSASVHNARARRCGRSRCVRATVDFATLDREPARRDEDGWTLRPLLQALGRHPVAARIGADGRLDRITLLAPRLSVPGPRIAVSLDLSHYGEVARVARVGTEAIAIE